MNERNARLFCGCSLAEVLVLNSGDPIRAPGSAAGRYLVQRRKALHRGIAWEISFPEWHRLWMDSGKWALRGVGIGTYCMARHGDEGPYKIGNVSIQLFSENCRDAVKRARPAILACTKLRPKLGRGRGWTLVPSLLKPYQVTVRSRYVGVYATQAEAEAAYATAVVNARRAHAAKHPQPSPS